jgi:microcystin-dependent protein
MAEPFLAEIRMMSFNYAPKGWALCNGQTLPINQNQALFALLGTTYGGNGQTNFALPDARGRVPIHFGAGFGLGQKGGAPSHSLSITELPAHNHSVVVTTNEGQSGMPTGNTFGIAEIYNNANSSLSSLNPATVTSVGGGQPHTNLQPSLTISFCIALQGIFPSQN